MGIFYGHNRQNCLHEIDGWAIWLARRVSTDAERPTLKVPRVNLRKLFSD